MWGGAMMFNQIVIQEEAIDIIKERAESICLTVHEDGVAHKLKELFDL